MPKTKISEFDSVPANNTDIDSINIAEGCAPSGINNAIRELMSQLKNQQTGADGDNFTVGGNLVVTGSSTFTGAVVMSTALPVASGGTGATSSAAAPFAIKGANSDITSITGLTTPLTVAQGGTGAATHTSKGVLIGNGTSAVTTVSPSTLGNVLTSDGTNWISSNSLNSDTAVATTSGTSVTFTSIPSWVKRITVLFNEVSTNGSSATVIQIGSGGLTTSGYISTSGGISAPANGISSYTNGFGLRNDTDTYNFSGHMVLTLVSGNTWVSSHTGKVSTGIVLFGGGSVTISGTLDRVCLATVNGTDTFDAGSINIIYE